LRFALQKLLNLSEHTSGPASLARLKRTEEAGTFEQ
jgi:hypothetical protein